VISPANGLSYPKERKFVNSKVSGESKKGMKKLIRLLQARSKKRSESQKEKKAKARKKKQEVIF
jgi:hypothetical protein